MSEITVRQEKQHLTRIDGFIAIESYAVFSWHTTKAAAMAAAERMLAYRQMINEKFDIDEVPTIVER